MTFPVNAERLIAGCMTGTSIDGIDAALIRIHDTGLEMRVELLGTASRSLKSVGRRLKRFADQEPLTASEISTLSHDFSDLHLQILQELVGTNKLDLIAVHGQTVFHQPPLSWQLINPTPIAQELNCPVVFDLRAADLAAGGQGAPITPLADFVLYRDADERRALVNLGGFCNLTRIPAGKLHETAESWVAGIDGFDLCVCNQLLDYLSSELADVPFDKGGLIAGGGSILPTMLKVVTAELRKQTAGKRSLGTGDELTQVIMSQVSHFRVADVLRTVCAAIASVMTVHGPVDRYILAGGGVKNETLVSEIQARTRCHVSLSDEYGIPAEYREAVAMAVLGALCQDRVPITLPQVTGVTESPISGCWVLP